MRTTLTLDEDLARELQRESRRTATSFKQVVNDALRRGLRKGAGPGPRPKRFRVRPAACGFQPGVDPMKLQQLLDEMDLERAAALLLRDR